MRPRLKYAETVFLSLLATGFIAASAFFWKTGFWHFLSEYNALQLKERADVIRLVFMGYGVFLGALSVASFILIHYHKSTLSALCVKFLHSVLGELRNLKRWLSVSMGASPAMLWVLLVTSVGLAIRSYFIAQPMRYDEASTFLGYVNKDFLHLFFYDFPNNHVFHTLLAKVSVTIFGNSPVAIRLPALLAGISVIPITFGLSRLLTKETGGYLSSALVAVFPYLVLYDTMARGYSLVVLFSLMLAIMGLYEATTPSLATCFLISLLASLGNLTMPSFLFPLAGLYLWMAILLFMRNRNIMHIIRAFILPCGVMTSGFTVVLYTPTIICSNGVHTLLNNPFVASLPWSDFLRLLPTHLFDTLAAFRRDVPIPLVFCVLLFVLLGIADMLRKKMWEMLLLFCSLLIGAIVVLLLKHAIPYDRTWIYLLPFAFILADKAFSSISITCRECFRRIPKFAVFILMCFWAIRLMSNSGIASYRDTCPFPEAPLIVEILATEMNQGDKVVVKCPADNQLYYYMLRKGVPKKSDFSGTTHKRVFFVVEKNHYSLGDLTKENVKKLLDVEGAGLYVRDLPEE